MALLKEYAVVVFGQEIKYPNAYHKVNSLVAIGKEIKVNMEIFNNESKEHLIVSDSFVFERADNTEPDLIQFAYQLIKTLPEYEGAFDIFDEGQPVLKNIIDKNG